MILIPEMKNKKVAVYGLGLTGVSAAEALIASGAHVYAWDENPAAREQIKNTAYASEAPASWPWAEIEFLVLSPGVPLTHPKPHAIVTQARKARVRIIGDVELFAEAINARGEGAQPKIVAITGSNGKSTTTALITHILAESGLKAFMGGNIGAPVLSLPDLHKDHIYVLELSSFQLDLVSSLRANIAVFLNITADHLDRHGDMAGYLAAKQRIFYNQTGDDFAVVGVDDEHSQGVCAVLSSKRQASVAPISTKGALGHGVYALDGRLFYNINDKNGEAGAIGDIATLRGAHNQQNACAALAAACFLGVAPTVAVKAMQRFEGLAHRMETISELSNVVFVNDSKATNVEAAAQALQSYDDIFWIAGGASKEGDDFARLRSLMPRVRTAYLVGDAAKSIEAQLAGSTPCVQSGNLAAAVSRAARDARQSTSKKAAVLLSPGCASIDQFKNFSERGDAFKRLVAAAVDAARESDQDGEAA